MKLVQFESRRGSDVARMAGDVLVAPVSGGRLRPKDVRAFDELSGKTLSARIADERYGAETGRTMIQRLPRGSRAKTLVLVGLGAEKKIAPDAWRRAGGAAARAVPAAGGRSASVFVGDASPDAIVAFAEGFALAGYRFDRYKKKPKSPRPEVESVVIHGDHAAGSDVKKRLDAIRPVTEAVFAARDLVNEPASEMTPAALARAATSLCRRRNVRVEVMGPKKIRDLKMNGVLAVTAGSEEEPRFLRIRYEPSGKPRARVALVGKGITFDSGGLSLKPAKAMETMKLDMSGAAAVIGAMAAIGRLRPRVAVTGYVAACENLPGGRAQKPGDVIRYRNGKSVEVLNTDAEGRLVLADALIQACDDGNDVVIDFATLTGACMVALGPRVAGMMGNDDDLLQALGRAGDEVGEDLWPLPLVRDYKPMLESKVADLKNIGGPYGGTITAGLFLQEFVGDVRWAHLDIAGPAFSETNLPFSPAGGTGFGIRAVLRYLEGL